MLEHVLSIVKKAGKIVLSFYGSEQLDSRVKEDGSSVTNADLQSQKCIVSLLKSTRLPVLAEESPVPYETRKNWNEFWLIDPLDGTRGFIDQTGEFTINVALIRNGYPVLGVISVPFLNELYYAEQGKGSFLERGGRTYRLPYKKQSERCLIGSGSENESRLQEFAQANGVEKIFKLGSSLKFGRLAEGTAHLYLREVSSKEWDIASGQIILSEAGGGIFDLTTLEPPLYNKASLKNNAFLACCPGIDWKSLKF